MSYCTCVITGIPKDKMCDESPIELKVETKVAWYLLQTPPLSSSSSAVQPPLSEGNLLLSTYSSMKQETCSMAADEHSYQIDDDDKWLSQVSHAVVRLLREYSRV